MKRTIWHRAPCHHLCFNRSPCPLHRLPCRHRRTVSCQQPCHRRLPVTSTLAVFYRLAWCFRGTLIPKAFGFNCLRLHWTFSIEWFAIVLTFLFTKYVEYILLHTPIDPTPLGAPTLTSINWLTEPRLYSTILFNLVIVQYNYVVWKCLNACHIIVHSMSGCQFKKNLYECT